MTDNKHPMVEATEKLMAARTVLGEVTMKLMAAKSTLTVSENKIVLEDAEYATLKNEAQRKAFLATKLAAEVHAVEQLELEKAKAMTLFGLAEDSVTCQRYLIKDRSSRGVVVVS